MALQIPNQAIITYQSGQKKQTALSNVTKARKEKPFQVSKQALEEHYDSQDKITYLLFTTNKTPQMLEKITIQDDLGKQNNSHAPLTYLANAQLYVEGHRVHDLSVETKKDEVAFTITHLAPHATAIVIYQAAINQYAPLAQNSQITTRSVWSSEDHSDALICTHTLQARPQAHLSITKTMSPNPVTSGQELTCVFQLANSGNIPAEVLTFEDHFDPAPEHLHIYIEGTPLNPEDYDYQQGKLLIHKKIIVPPAQYEQDSEGERTLLPGLVHLTVSGPL